MTGEWQRVAYADIELGDTVRCDDEGEGDAWQVTRVARRHLAAGVTMVMVSNVAGTRLEADAATCIWRQVPA